MNEQTPRDPQQPIGANDPTPQHPTPADTSAQTVQQPIPNPAGVDDAPKRGRGILKPVLIGAGAAVAVLAVAGIGLSVADALDDGNDQAQTQPGATAPMTSAPAPTQTDDSNGSGGSGDDQGGTSTMGPGNGASVEPSAMVDAIDAAVAAAGGEGATAIELERDSWKVDVQLADRTEVDVRVFFDDREPLVQQDDDDSSNDALLDTSRIADIVDAAVTAAGGGTVEKIETEDDDRHAFEVQVDLGNGDDVDVELADDLSVVSIDD